LPKKGENEKKKERKAKLNTRILEREYEIDIKGEGMID
jgi:hypothetical protein